MFIFAIFSILMLKPAYSHNLQCQTAEDCALEDALDYCDYIYRFRKSYFTCQRGAAKTYEHVLSEQATDFNTICHPYYLSTCDSGRIVFLAKLKLRKEK